MNPVRETYKSFIKLYWFIYIILVSFLLILIFLRIISVGLFGEMYMLFCFFPIIILNYYEWNRLMGYLARNHYEKWVFLTSNRCLPFMFSKDNLNDTVVEELKTNCKKIMFLIIVAVITLPVLAVLISVNFGLE